MPAPTIARLKPPKGLLGILNVAVPPVPIVVVEMPPPAEATAITISLPLIVIVPVGKVYVADPAVLTPDVSCCVTWACVQA